MEKVRRIKLDKVYQDEIHHKDFLEWVHEQTERIKEISNVIAQLQEAGSFKRVITVAKINECLARFMEFYSTQVAFLQVYKEYHSSKSEAAAALYDTIYLDVQGWAIDPNTNLGKKYAKKSATMKEIERESKSHPSWGEYFKLKKEADNFEKKISAQRRFLKGLEKWDIILESLKKRDDKEFKYLYLET